MSFSFDQKMVGGLVVPDYSEEYIHCGYCGAKLEWKTVSALIPFDTTTGEAKFSKTYGCPNYGKDYTFHYHWWENIFYKGDT